MSQTTKHRHHEGVEVDEDQAGRHDQVRHQREGGQVLQVGREDQQDEGGQEAERVETGVEARHQDLGLVGEVGVAAEGGGVGGFDHLVEERSHMVSTCVKHLCEHGGGGVGG